MSCAIQLNQNIIQSSCIVLQDKRSYTSDVTRRPLLDQVGGSTKVCGVKRSLAILRMQIFALIKSKT